ncbi:unnamed protein product [Kluyveromyces dobzhanskii CBS 2104]|uniref:Autophagy-related protein 14 n=1 Tax=Kluyveromyces dobzhanskii CBS 2104 TaxID=1427455 RepID=A0A0A8L487_9SACH|nr:unnamed protein product [Kluyveromyces dobzhanskii CBS 2104]
MKLLLLQQEVEQLKEEVGKQLDGGFAGKGQLGKQLQKLDVYNEKHRLVKLRQRVHLVKNKLDSKRDRHAQLEQHLKDRKRSQLDGNAQGIEEVVAEETLGMRMLSQVLQRNQSVLFAELCQWFRIEKCDEESSSNLSAYTIWEMPIANLKYTNEMEPEKLILSMQYVQQYISFSLNIWLFEGTSDVPITNDQSIIQNYSQLIYNTLRLLRARNLVSESVSIRDILIRYDLDGMLYHFSRNIFLSSLDDASNAYPPTLQNIKLLVTSMIPSI